MAKKMTSEVPLPNSMFNAKLGTLNKTNPETVYVELGTFITPNNDNETPYEEIIKALEKRFRLHIEKNNQIFNKNYICNFDIASNRIKRGKKSFLSIICYLKPNDIQRLEELQPRVTSFVDSISKEFNDDLANADFQYSKTKKVKTIYKETE